MRKALIIGATVSVGLASITSAGAAASLDSFKPVTIWYTPAAVDESVNASPDGNTLVHIDAEDNSLGFVDVTDPGAGSGFRSGSEQSLPQAFIGVVIVLGAAGLAVVGLRRPTV